MSDTHHFASEFARSETSRLPRRNLYSAYGKRVFDISFALFLLPLLAPVIALLCLVVGRDGAAVFFRHERIGRNGRSFDCLKLRTMVPDADARLQSYLLGNADAQIEWSANFKLTNDPRITPFGRFLRCSGLDELPQIWNVLRGDMSFVGPRPVTEPELEKYGSNRRAYLSVRPGVTGMWQIHGRKTGCYENRVRLDRGYLRSVSLKTDIVLIGQTALSMVRMTGT